MQKALLPALLASTLAACGGGGGGGGGGGFGGVGTADLAAANVAAAGTSTTAASGASGASGATVAAASPAVAAAAGSPPVTSSVLDGAGVVAAAQYRATAAQMGKDAGLTYRYGPSASYYGAADPSVPTLFKRNDNFSRCNSSGQNCLTSWQVGGPRNPGDATNDQAAAGSYSTNQANVSFLADNPAVRVGVGDLQVSAFEYNTFSQMPQLPWQNTMALNSSGGLDSVTVAAYKTSGLLSADGESRPVASARCEGRTGFCASSIVAFQNGLLGTAGSNTAHNATTAKLAPNKVPTAVAMTNSSEFALVTVWDTVALKGQVAVVALAGLCDGCAVGGPYYSWWGEWKGVYPGLPNMGNIGYMKVLGYVDLPADMKAPTEIAVTTGMDQFQTTNAGAFVGEAASPLTTQANRDSFISGANASKYAKSGIAVVISKEEQKVAFIDLKPLFNYVNGVYFSNQPSSTFTNLGPADNQWPHAFAFAAQATPTVIKTITLDQRPTAVRTTVYGNTPRAWVATQESAAQGASLRIFDLGSYTSGGTGSAAQLTEKGRVAVGRNPTSLATSKSEPSSGTVDALNQQVILTSRGDRKVQWVRFAADGNSGTIARELKDSRLVDPIASEDIDNFANVGNAMSVADFDGKKVANYRYGPAIFADRGGSWACQPPGGCPVQPTAGVNIEFGGSFAMQGKPFHINTSNVP